MYERENEDKKIDVMDNNPHRSRQEVCSCTAKNLLLATYFARYMRNCFRYMNHLTLFRNDLRQEECFEIRNRLIQSVAEQIKPLIVDLADRARIETH